MNRHKLLPIVTVLVLCAAVPVALAATLPARAKYVGKTSDGKAVRLKLNGSASRITQMRIHYTVRCSDGGRGQTYTDILGVRLGSSHGFSMSGSYTGSGDGSQNTFKVSGKLGPKRAHGKFSLKSSGQSKGTTRTCKSRKLSWSAKRKK
jgi:hypothetical protein